MVPTVPFPMTLNDPKPDFKVTPLFDTEYLRNDTRYRNSYNGILIETYIRPIQGCHFE